MTDYAFASPVPRPAHHQTPDREDHPVTTTTEPTLSDSRVEYGAYGPREYSDSLEAWPDIDGEIMMTDGPAVGDFVPAADPEALRAALQREGKGRRVIQRVIGAATFVEQPLPTTPGSVVRAATADNRRGVFVLNGTSAEYPWTGRPTQGTSGPYRRHADSWPSADLRDVEILFDAGAAT